MTDAPAPFAPRPDDTALYFVPLGGAGEIGMNLNLFYWAGAWLMVDLGITFGDDTTPGVEVIMPDPGFIAERRDALAGIVLTHAHEDHIGAVPYLWQRLRAPLYATPFTASVLRRKLEEAGLAGEAEVVEVPLSGAFSLGPFRLELITLTHSIPEPNAIVIRTDHGTILHTGDWKLDPTPLVGPPPDEDALRRLGDEGVLAMIGDSTNVFRKGWAGSEAAVRESLVRLVKKRTGRVAIACFASNIARLATVAAVAEATGRNAALVGRSLWRMYEAALENDYLTDIPPFLSDTEAGYLPNDKVLLACTGSQGEPRAALARIAAGDHPHIALGRGDTVIFSSRVIPGNERAIGRLQNALAAGGVEVVTEYSDFVHVSGHPARDELVRMYQWVRPQIAVPVHGELRHLIEHCQLAKECQVTQAVQVENGTVLRLAPRPAEIVGHVPTGRLALDGSDLVPLEGESLKARKRIAFNGAALATVVLDENGELAGPPQISAPGVVESGEGALLNATVRAAELAVREMSRAERRDDASVEETVRRAVRREIAAVKGRRPPTTVHLVRLSRAFQG